jgi:hypothetical protein
VSLISYTTSDLSILLILVYYRTAVLSTPYETYVQKAFLFLFGDQFLSLKYEKFLVGCPYYVGGKGMAVS